MIHSNLKESNFIVPKNQNESDEAIFEKRKHLSKILSLISVILIIGVRIIFGWSPILMNRIYSFFFTFLWVLPVLFILMRNYLRSFLSVQLRRYGNILFTFANYFIFLTIGSLIGFILLGYEIEPIHLFNTMKWISIGFFIPYLLAVLIVR